MSEINKKFNIWEGIYQSFEEVKVEHSIFEGEHWGAKALERLEKDLEKLDINKTIQPVAIARDYPLSVVVALLSIKNSIIRVLDWGGGVAQTYLSIKYSMQSEARLEYIIVDNSNAVSKAKDKLSSLYPDLRFHEKIPSNLQKVDVIHIGSALQYVEDWKGLLSDLLKMKPKYFVLSDLMAGDIPTYVGAQYYYGTRMPVWFWNLSDFIKTVDGLNYQLFYKNLYMARILGKECALPMSNLPKRNRLQYTCNLIFKYADK